MENIDYSALPERMIPSARRYIENRIDPGSFLRAIFENNFLGAFLKADSENTRDMRKFAIFLYSLPRQYYGSAEIVDAWLKGKD